MKLACEKKNLQAGIKQVLPAIPGRSFLPILANILMSTDQGQIKLTATNLEMSIRTWIDGEIATDGSTTVPAHLLSDLVSALPEKQINIELKSNRLHIDCEQSRAKIPTVPPTDYPPIPDVVGAEFEIGPVILHDAIRRSVLATSTSTDRPVLTGISLKSDGKELAFAGADGFQLTVYKTPLNGKFESVIPRETMLRVATALENQKEPVKIVIGEKQALFHLKSLDIQSSLIQSTFPNYSQLIPQSYATAVTFKRADMLATTRAASIFAQDGIGILRCEIGESIKISSMSKDAGDYETTIECKREGEPNKFSVNSAYISKLLAAWDEEEIKLELTNSSSPIVFKAVGKNNLIHIIMPLFVQREEVNS